MMNKINVDTNNSIEFAQPFDVEGVPQMNISQSVLDAAEKNTSPKPLNIKIKVKNKEEIARGFGVTFPKLSTTGPKKIRLVSSDQTIISFDLFMETGNEKKIPKKTHNKFFELFKPSGCFNNQNDDDVYPYVPSSSNETYRAKSVSQVNGLQDDKIYEEKFALKKNLEPMMSTNMTLKTPTFLGKCKPGGCLDPPFSEDKYIYKPKHNTSAIEKQDLDETCYKDTKHTAKDIDIAEISSQDSPSKSSIEKKCSRSLITYPPALSSSDIRDQEEILSKKSKLRTSTENNVRLSINKFSDIYYMPPKKQKSKSNEKLSPEVSENLNVRCDSFDTYSLTGHKKGQKKERISSSKNELQATDLNVGNPHMNERCQKKTENILLNDNYNATIGEMVKIETLKVSSISDLSDTNLDIFEDTVEKKINRLASSQTNIEGTENRETETKIDINVLETNVDNSYVSKSSLIFKNKITPENLPTIAKDSRMSKIESDSKEKLSKLPVPDKSVDNHLVARKERNKLPIENQSLRSYRLFNSDETKMKLEPLIPPDEVTLKSSQTAVIERSTDSTKLDQMKGCLITFEESDNLSVEEQKKYGKHKESTYSSIKEQIHDNQHKECDHSLIKEDILDREYKDSDHSSTKKQIQVKEDKESDLSTIKEQIQDRKYDNFKPSSLKEQTQGRERKESDVSSVKEQIEHEKYKESYHSSVKEEFQDKIQKNFDRSSLKEQTQDREYKESDHSSLNKQLQDREHKISDLPSVKDQIQDRDYKESDHSSSKEQIQDKEYKESDYLSIKEQKQDRKYEESDQSSIKAQIKDKKPLSSIQPSVKEQIQAREDKGIDHSSVKEELRDREHKISNPSSLKEQIRDIEYNEYDHSSVKEQLRDRNHKISDGPSLKELIQDKELKESNYSSVKEQIQNREYEESDQSSSKVQIRDKKLKESDYSSIKDQTQDRECEESDHSLMKEQIQDRKYEESDQSSSRVQIRDKELKESDYSSVKDQTQDREREESDHSSMKEQIQDKEHMASNHSSVKEQIQDREYDEFDNASSKVQIRDKELKQSDYSSVKEQTQDREGEVSDHSSMKEQIQVREDKESDHYFVKEQTQYRENDNFDYLSIKEHTQGNENKKSDHASVIELIGDRVSDRDHKVSDHSSLKEQIQDREITDVNQKVLQQNSLLQDVDSHDIFDKQGLHEIIDKNNVQDFATLMLGVAADQKPNNRMSREPWPLFQENISSTLQTQKEDNNDLIYYANRTSLATSQIMKLTPTLNSTSLTLPTQKKDTIGNEPVGYENKNSLATSQIMKPTSSLNLAIPDKTSSILQTQENTNDKHPEYYEDKINLATSHILKLPINLSERTTKPTDNLKIQSSEDNVQGLSSIVPIEVQSIKNIDIDHRYGVFNEDILIENEESGDKRSIEIKPQFQTNKSKVTSIPADNEMARYYSTDVSAAFNKKIENQPQMISNEYPDIYQKTSNLNIPESYSASSKKSVVKTDKMNVMELEEENVHDKNSFLKINLGFYSYVNDKNQIVIKSFDTSKHLKKDPRAKKTIIKSIIRKNDSGIRIPVNSEMDLTLQIEKSLDIDTKKESTKKASRKSLDEGILLQETVVSVYENLVPVENLIRNLKEEAGFLTQQQVLLREMLNTMKTTSMKIDNTNNKMCNCNRYSM